MKKELNTFLVQNEYFNLSKKNKIDASASEHFHSFIVTIGKEMSSSFEIKERKLQLLQVRLSLLGFMQYIKETFVQSFDRNKCQGIH